MGLFGKYLNTWNIRQTTWPPGFERWFANDGGNDVEPGGYVNASFQDQQGCVGWGCVGCGVRRVWGRMPGT